MNERADRRLIIEAKVSVGPRKSRDKHEDYGSDVCEDCAGYISYKEFTIFWICNGIGDSSELPKRAYLPGFSVRILAQDLGEGFGNRLVNVLATGVDPCIANMGTEVLNGIADNWRKRLIEYLGDVEDKRRAAGAS